MSRRDTFDPSPRVRKFKSFREEVQLRGIIVPNYGYRLVFVMPMPNSWSKKKKAAMCGTIHQQTPDKDNLEKGLLDAINYGKGNAKNLDDKQVADGRVTKVWGYHGSITVIVEKPEISEQWLAEAAQIAVGSAPQDPNVIRL